MAEFIDALSDYGFKYLFGRKNHSEKFLIDFLNSLFEDQVNFSPIVKIRYLNTEALPDYKDYHTVRFDLYCETADKRRFIIEMQSWNQNYFFRRALFYVALSIAHQAIKKENSKAKDWKFQYMPVHGIFLCDFHVNGLEKKLISNITLEDNQSHIKVSNLLSLTFIQFPYFKKKIDECVTDREKWFYVLKNMKSMQSIPFTEIKDRMFAKLEEMAKIDKMTPKERLEYETAQRFAWDYNARMSDAREKGFKKGKSEGLKERLKEGIKEGIKEGQWNTAKNLFKMNMDIKDISIATNIPENELIAKFRP